MLMYVRNAWAYMGPNECPQKRHVLNIRGMWFYVAWCHAFCGRVSVHTYNGWHTVSMNGCTLQLWSSEQFSPLRVVVVIDSASQSHMLATH